MQSGLKSQQNTELMDDNNNTNGKVDEDKLKSSATSKAITNIYKRDFSIWRPSTWFNMNLSVNEMKLHELESEMFSCLRNPYNRYFVKINKNKHPHADHIWTISVNEHLKKTPIVFVHGFCGGIGMWIQNIDSLSDKRPFYAFDLLGFGRSSRPNFSKDPLEAEKQFVDSIEQWRKELKLDKIILLGHSFGGYLSAAYALEYPQNVKALLLIDAWGFPDPKIDNPLGHRRTIIFKVVENFLKVFNPLSLFRISGQFGINMFKKVRPDFQRKYANLLTNEDLVYNYIYYANSFNPSGEEAFGVIAGPFGCSKNPMINRFHQIDHSLDVYFVYGANSWIKAKNGHKAARLRSSVSKTEIKVIENAGHHVYADQPGEFNEYIKYILIEIE